MKILALDTAQAACSAALAVDGVVVASRFEPMSGGHAERLAGQLREVMDEGGVTMGALDRLAVTIGPGSFTGTRIALATARGMALALDCPIVPVTTLEAIAFAAGEDPNHVRVAVFDARRGELYLQAFEGAALTPLDPPRLLSHEQAGAQARDVAGGRPLVLVGTGAEILAGQLEQIGIANVALSGGHGLPDAAHVARIAATRDPASHPPSPLYLREPDAKIPEPK